MRIRISLLLFLLLVACEEKSKITPHQEPKDTKPSKISQWVEIGDDGKLTYQTTSKGDRIADYSHAGYGGGGVKLPDIPIKKEVSPSGGDDTAAIQSAIDEVAALPLENGFCGAVLLKAGIFHCSQPIKLSLSGVVLRGSGSGKDGTRIEMTGDPHVCIAFHGGRIGYPKEKQENIFSITDPYIPSGAEHISVKDSKELTVGDAIRIRWPRTAKWIHFMGMDKLVRNNKPQTWMKDDSPITYERTIHSIDGNRIRLDIPLTEAIDSQFLAPSTAVIVKTVTPKRLTQCGLEALTIFSPPPSGDLRASNNIAVTFDSCEDCWISDVEMIDTLLNVKVEARGRRITIQKVNAIHTATVEKGAGAPADFLIVGSQVLLDRCTSIGDGSFYVATLKSSAALNVALNCKFQGKGGIQPHMHWSTGLLLDSCDLLDGRIEFINRGTCGSGHGWAIGSGVAWNCRAAKLDIQQPPGAMNWCIGCTGEFKHAPASSEQWLSSHGKTVNPSSLYLAQLQERLGKNALKNIGY
jgi:hypothetical protein